MAAFDPLASTYDAAFTQTATGQYLRARVQARLDRHFRAGDHVLELGCGTGEDALHLAERGVHVLATDASPAMLAITQAKAAGNPLIMVEKFDLRGLPALTPRPPLPQGEGKSKLVQVPLHEGEGRFAGVRAIFDGAFANFGPVNVLDDWRPLAVWLAERVKPGGIVGLGVMGPLCLWEIAWHGLHGDFRTAFRRGSGSATFQAADSAEPLPVYYPSIARLKRDFAPGFRCIHVEALGLCLPPSDVYGVIERRPRLLKRLMALEDRLAGFAPLARLADHYWIEFERQ
ncbi:MAG: methyltransferase domain-containing protein [Anaerolineae bacterium]|nr:methyltransferase domain-containing protein [Anaerolineae bacterium]